MYSSRSFGATCADLGSFPSLQTIAVHNRLDTESEKIQNELSLTYAKMSRLQAKQESLNESLRAAQGRVEELATQLDRERHEGMRRKDRSLSPGPTLLA